MYMFIIAMKYGQQMSRKSRRKAMTREEIDVLIHPIASTTKANRHFVFDKTTALGEAVLRAIVLPATNIYFRQEYLPALAPALY